ncbi:MAG: 2-amino-4-hydroxy-6-hydroxymethyldihydropteridine diphosphokinase [Desulfobacterales bacterium]
MTESFPHTAYIAVGSNMGNKLAWCQKGIAELEKKGTSSVTACSRFYRTEPVDFTDQDWFVNAVVRVSTALNPHELLAQLNAIEFSAGRIRTRQRFGPRTLDMDIVFYDDVIMDSPNLILPHPRMHKRHFVLQPICDIDASLVHPRLRKTVSALLNELEKTGQEIVPMAIKENAA